jgi:hypothetical protein
LDSYSLSTIRNGTIFFGRCFDILADPEFVDVGAGLSRVPRKSFFNFALMV